MDEMIESTTILFALVNPIGKSCGPGGTVVARQHFRQQQRGLQASCSFVTQTTKLSGLPAAGKKVASE